MWMKQIDTMEVIKNSQNWFMIIRGGHIHVSIKHRRFIVVTIY